MKKILIILITIPLIFGSCEIEDDSPDSNSNNSNNPTQTTGYVVDNSGYVSKTTDSAVTWTTKNGVDLGSPEGISF